MGQYTRAEGRSNGFASGDQIMKVVQAPSTEMTLEFKFVDGLTGAPVTLENRAFTFFDIDGNQYRDLKETVTVCGTEQFFVSADTALESSDADGCRTYQPVTDDGYSNPTETNSLTDVQLAHSFTAVFCRASSFRVTAGFIGSGKNPRPLLFAGVQAIGTCSACSLLPSPTTTTTTTPAPTPYPTPNPTPSPTPAPTRGCNELSISDFAGRRFTISQTSSLYGRAQYTYDIQIGGTIVQHTSDSGDYLIGSHQSYGDKMEYFGNGDRCGSTPRRATVTYTFGSDMRLLSANEPSMCNYVYAVQLRESDCGTVR